MEDSSLPYNLAISAYDIFFYFHHIQNFHFPLIERTLRLLLGLEALPASLLLCFGDIIMVNKGFLNTNTAIMRQQNQTARMLHTEWWQVCREATGRIWAAVFHHATACACWVRVSKLMNRLFL